MASFSRLVRAAARVGLGGGEWGSRKDLGEKEGGRGFVVGVNWRENRMWRPKLICAIARAVTAAE